MKTKKITEKVNWVIIFYDKKNNVTGFDKIKDKTEVEAENEIATMKQPANSSGWGLFIDEEKPFKATKN